MPELGEPLSERELEVLRLVATGATNRQIANELFISVNTVKVHLRNIFAKLGVASRTKASLYAIRQGLIGLPQAEEEQAQAEPPPAGETIEAPPAEATPTAPWPRWLLLSGVVVILLLVLLFGLTGLPYRWLQNNFSPSPARPTPVQRWSQLSDMPTPRAGLALVPFQEFLYAVGGEETTGMSRALERFDPFNDHWTPLAAKPTGVSGIRAAVLGGRIYVPGGRQEQGRPTEVVEVYDVAGNRWLTVASLPRPLSDYALVSFEGSLYLLGGWDGSDYRDEILQYDPDADEWVELGSRLPFPWAEAGAVVASNSTFLVGGKNSGGPLNVIVRYTVPSFLTYEIEPLPGIVLGSAQATALGDWLYVLAEPAPGAAPLLWKHHLRTDRWQEVTTAEPSPFGLYPGSALAAAGAEYLVIVGGRENESFLPLTQQFRALFTVVPGAGP